MIWNCVIEREESKWHRGQRKKHHAFARATAHCSRFPVSCSGWSWWVPKGCGQGSWLSGAHFSALKANRESGHWPASPGGAPEGPGGSQERPLLWEWIFGNASCVCYSDYESKGCISQAQWPISGNASWFKLFPYDPWAQKWWWLPGNGNVRARWKARGNQLWENCHLSPERWGLLLWHCVLPLFTRLSSAFLLVSKFN